MKRHQIRHLIQDIAKHVTMGDESKAQSLLHKFQKSGIRSGIVREIELRCYLLEKSDDGTIMLVDKPLFEVFSEEYMVLAIKNIQSINLGAISNNMLRCFCCWIGLELELELTGEKEELIAKIELWRTSLSPHSNRIYEPLKLNEISLVRRILREIANK